MCKCLEYEQEKLLHAQRLMRYCGDLENNAVSKTDSRSLNHKALDGSKDSIRVIRVIFWIKNAEK